MSDEDIDLDRVVVDPEYRRQVIAFLNGAAAETEAGGFGDDSPASVHSPAVTAG